MTDDVDQAGVHPLTEPFKSARPKMFPNWESEALVRVMVFLALYLVLMIAGAVFGQNDAAAETAKDAVAAADAWVSFLINTLVVDGLPIVIMLSVCARSIPPGHRMRAWWFDTHVPGLPTAAWIRAALLAIMAVALNVGASWLLKHFFNYDPVDPYEELLHGANRSTLLVFILSAVIFAPVAEEMFFRHVLHQSVRCRSNERTADIVTAVLFGAVHMQPAAFPALAVLGYALQRIRARSHSLALPILTHACFNAIMVAYMLWSLNAPG